MKAAAQPRISRPRQPSAERVLLDTGVLVGLLVADDPAHSDAAAWLARCTASLHTVEPVLTETAFFCSPRSRAALARLAAEGTLHVHALDAAAHRRMAELAEKYADRDADWADLALVWLAETSGVHRIATLDAGDFAVYRIHGRRRFELELLR